LVLCHNNNNIKNTVIPRTIVKKEVGYCQNNPQQPNEYDDNATTLSKKANLLWTLLAA
jgi:hypothetical protein